MKTRIRILAILAACLLLLQSATGLAQPVITTQPQTQTNAVGTTATFSVEAIGAPPLNYQWRKSSSLLEGAINSTLVFTNVEPANQGIYSVVISNSEGSVTSMVARLYVFLPPSITTHPTNLLADIGGVANFTVTVSGTAPLSYQWHKDEGVLAGKTTSSLMLANVQYTNAGRYFVTVMNAVGSATSHVAILTVGPAPHGLSRITALADGAISLNLTGTARSLFTAYCDLYLLEASTNLTAWTLLATLQRTNADPSPLTYLDPDAAHFDARFYRTPTNHLITFLPPPTGPYAVGTLSRLLTDPSRTNTARRTHHQFMISFWYPAIAQAGMLPVPYVERALAQSSYWYAEYTSLVPFFVSHSLSNAALASSPIRFPIVLYSPGADLHRRDNTDKAEELASHGYIVVGLDHRETPLSVFPDGTPVTGEPVDQSSYQGSVAQIQGRVQDERFVLDELARLDAADPMFGGRLDLDRIGAFGFSRGGAAAAQLCYSDPRCKAGVNMDGWFLISNAVQIPLPVPFLIVHSDTPDVTMLDGRPDDIRPTFNTMTANGYFLTVGHSQHWNFDNYFFRNQTPAFRRVHQIWAAYILSFFNKHLLSQNDGLLDGPSPYPEVIEFLKK